MNYVQCEFFKLQSKKICCHTLHTFKTQYVREFYLREFYLRELYTGQTRRLLQTRASEHQMSSKNTHVYQHISTCPTSIKQASEFVLNYKNNYTSPQKAKVNFFKSRFSIIEKGFQNEYTRRKCEAYHIIYCIRF